MTGYVATRWYRAPEIILNWMHYNQTGMTCTASWGFRKTVLGVFGILGDAGKEIMFLFISLQPYA